MTDNVTPAPSEELIADMLARAPEVAFERYPTGVTAIHEAAIAELEKRGEVEVLVTEGVSAAGNFPCPMWRRTVAVPTP